jgi:hypothetical protein
MRPGCDIFQMDAGLSYGLIEYARMLEAGHLINLHIAAGLGSGGCESYPDVFQPSGGYPDGCAGAQGRIAPTDAPGFGLEQKPGLAELIADLGAGG